MGLTGATAINVANIIGTGVFLKARVMTCNVESAAAVLLAWVLTGLMVLAGGLCYSELATMMPEAGGEYVYLRRAFGRRIAFLYGWTYIFIARAAMLAAQTVGCAIFINIVTGGLIQSWLTPAALLVLAASVALNCLAVSLTGKIAAATMIFKAALVGGVGLVTLLFASGDWMHFGMMAAGAACEGVPPGARGGMPGFGAAMVAALWGYMGWANLAPMAGEVRDPSRNLPRAFLFAIAIVAAAYLTANISYFYALTPMQVASVSPSSSVAAEALRKAVGPGAASLLAMGMTASSFTALHTGMAAVVRMPYALAADGIFFPVMARLSPAGVPVVSALFIGSWSALLTFSGNYDQITDYAVFAQYVFFALTAAAVIVLRRREPNVERPFRLPAYPFVPALFVLISGWLFLNTLFTSPLRAFSALGLILLGLPFYAYWDARPHRKHSL
jgi:APA family basic amino acid/polyamine antiporter